MSVFRTGAGLLAARLCQPMFAFLLFGSAARLLDEHSFGAYVLLMGMIILFQACSSLGLVPLMTRELSKDLDRAGTYLGGAALIMIPASLLSWIIFPPVLSIIGASAETSRLGWILGASLPFTTIILAAETLFVAHGSTRPIIIQNFCENIVRVTVSLVLLFMGYGVSMLLTIFVITRAASACFILLRLRSCPFPRKFAPHERGLKCSSGTTLYGLMSLRPCLFQNDIIALTASRGESVSGSSARPMSPGSVLTHPRQLCSRYLPRLSKACMTSAMPT
jgi:O-antigen/teichoic acid export membrane protein